MQNEQSHYLRDRFLLLMQFAVILAPFALFYDAALLYKGRMNLSLAAMMIFFVILNGGLLLLALFSCLSYSTYRKAVRTKPDAYKLNENKRFLNYLPVTLVSIVFTILAAFQFDNVPRYDGGLYYDALITATETFDFSLNSIVSAFTLITHPMQGTALFIGTGEMLFPRQAIGVYGVSLIITIAAIYCLYGILGRIFPDKAPWLKAGGTAVFAFCPYVLGLFSHISPDYYSAMFFVILVFLFAVELDYLAAFMSLLLIFSRETGILFAAFFLVPAVLIRTGKMNGHNYFFKLKKYLFPKRLLLYGSAPVLFAYYIFSSNGLTFGRSVTEKSSFRWDSNGVQCFGFYPPYVSERLKQIIFLNFFWVITLLVVAAIFVYLLKKLKHTAVNHEKEQGDDSITVGIAASTIAYMIFSCLFITIMCPRYNVFFAFPYAIISIGAISYIWSNRAVVKTITGALILLFLLQNYLNIDPSFLGSTEAINLGYQKIYPASVYLNYHYVTEMYVYNRTNAYSDDLMDQMMERIHPDKKDQFVFIGPDWYELYFVGDVLYTTHLIYWDPIRQERTYDDKAKDAFLPAIYLISRDDIGSEIDFDLNSDFYLVLPARADKDSYCSFLEARGYDISDSFVVSNYIGYLNVYHFTIQ